jgi:hypothetical protein
LTAFPSFGSERSGAPVVAFCLIADTPIRLREPTLRTPVSQDFEADPFLWKKGAGALSLRSALFNEPRW